MNTQEREAQRLANARHRQKRKSQGLVERTFWVPADKADTVRLLCNELVEKHLAALPHDPPQPKPAQQPPTETYDWL